MENWETTHGCVVCLSCFNMQQSYSALCFDITSTSWCSYLHPSTFPRRVSRSDKIKPPYLHTCSFSQAASPFVCVSPRTWPSPGSEFMQHHEKTSTWCTYQWRSEALAQRQQRLSGASTGWKPSPNSGIVIHVFTDCLSRLRSFWVPSTHPKKPNQSN